MTDTSAFNTQGRIGGGPQTFFVKDKNGVISEVEIPREQFQAPMDGAYHLKLKALSAPFERTDGTYGPSRQVRAVFVVKAPGNPNDKRMFSCPLSIAKPNKATGNWQSNITNKSAPGQMIVAIRGKAIGEGEPINLLDYLNGDFRAMVSQTTKTSEFGVEVYGNIVKDSWKPLGQQQMAEPEPVGVAAAPANPYLSDDD